MLYLPSPHFNKNSIFKEEFYNFLKIFNLCSPVPLTVLNLKGISISPSFCLNNFCEAISYKKKCFIEHQKSFQKVLKTRKNYRFKCFLGLENIYFPIIKGETFLIGFLGQFLANSSTPSNYLSSISSLPNSKQLTQLYYKNPVLLEEKFKEYIKELQILIPNFIRLDHLEKKEFINYNLLKEIPLLNEGAYSISELLKIILKKIIQFTKIENAAITLINPQGFKAFECSSILKSLKGIEKFKFILKDEVSRIVASTGEPLISSDISKDSRLVKKSTKKMYLKSLLSLPLKIGEKVNGVLHLFTVKNIHHFLPEEVDFTASLAYEIALIIERLKLAKETENKNQELEKFKNEVYSYFIQIGKALTSALNLDQLLNLILDLSLNLTKSTDGSLYLIKDNNIITRVFRGLDLNEEQIQPGNNLERSNNSDGFYKKINSYLGIPLVIKDKVKGILNIYDRKHRQFNDFEVDLLYVFASQSALAIENLQFFELEQHKAKEAIMLYKSARAIGQNLNFNEVIKLSLEQLIKLTEIDRALILILDEKTNEFTVKNTFGLSSDQKEFFSYFRLPLTHIEGEIWDTLKAGKPLAFSSVPPDCSPFEKLFNILPTSSCLIIPIIFKEDLNMIIYLDSSKGAHYFTSSQIRMSMTLAIQISVALQRAKLVAQLEENFNQLKALYQISTNLTGTLNLPKVFNLIVDKTVKLIHTSACSLLIWDDFKKQFEIKTSQGVSPNLLEYNLQNQIAKAAVLKKRPAIFYLSRNERSITEQAANLQERKSILSVPLIFKKDIIGIINCFAEEGYQFKPQEIRLLRNFANQAVVSLENAKLYKVIKDKVKELATLFEVGKALTSSLELEEVLDKITLNIMKVMKADACSIMLIDETKEELSIKSSKGLGKHHYNQKIKIGEGVAGIAIKTERPMILLDLKEDEFSYKFPKSVKKDNLKTILSVPLKAKEEILGLLNIYLKEIYYYSQNEINLLTTLANQSAMAIENAKLYQEQLSFTQIIRSSFIPSKLPKISGIELGYKYIPTAEFSGDYYDLIPLDKKHFAIVIADVSGRGTQAAIYTARGKYMLKSLAYTEFPPSEVLRLVNNLIYPETEAGKFISLFYGIIDLEKKEIIYSLAGHEPPILYRNKVKKVEFLNADGILIGIEQNIKFEERKISFSSGDLLILYTDGITEARSRSGEIFGLERLLEIIEKYNDINPLDLTNKIHTLVQKFTRRNLRDDFTLLIIKF
ncbi:MAG: GAF domain-containing protein [Armatimonadetes bacterium]|nr:GAF domain-containing protein [Armatimonadota bacterium]